CAWLTSARDAAPSVGSRTTGAGGGAGGCSVDGGWPGGVSLGGVCGGCCSGGGGAGLSYGEGTAHAPNAALLPSTAHTSKSTCLLRVCTDGHPPPALRFYLTTPLSSASAPPCAGALAELAENALLAAGFGLNLRAFGQRDPDQVLAAALQVGAQAGLKFD